MKSGFININKPKGLTSHDVVAKLRKILKMKRIGHSGTLDPFATGVLALAIGSSTRLIQFLKKSKRYLAEVDFSYQTDTDDLTGEPLENKFETSIKGVADKDFKWSEEDLRTTLDKMHGSLEQIPPLYSAIHHNGKRLHELCRAGEKIDLSEIKKRNVEIKEIKLLSFNYPKATIELACSEGTYIRSIARDLGGHLTKLQRLESNGLELEDSFSIEELENIDLDKALINSPDILAQAQIQLTSEEVADLRQGKRVHISEEEFNELDQASNSHLACLGPEEDLIGIGILVKVPNYIYIQPKVIL